jgi:hypothetical protein
MLQTLLESIQGLFFHSAPHLPQPICSGTFVPPRPLAEQGFRQDIQPIVLHPGQMKSSASCGRWIGRVQLLPQLLQELDGGLIFFPA